MRIRELQLECYPFRHKLGMIIRHRYYYAHRLAAVALLAIACCLTGVLAKAQTNDLLTAAQRGDLPVVIALLRSGIDANARRTESDPTTALILASRYGQLEVVQALLAAKANVNAGAGPGENGTTALMQASAQGNLKMVQALLAANANVDAKGPLGVTALYRASLDGSLEVVQALLAAKADPSPQLARLGDTPLTVALSQRHWDIARVLVEAGANVNATTASGVTALVLAARENSPRSLMMVQALLAAHADVNGNFLGADTALGVAASTGSVEVVQALLAAKSWVDVNIKQHDGRTPLMNASANGRADVVRLLLAAKADVSAQGNDGRTALMLALQNDHAEVAKLLTSASFAVLDQK